jgi:serine protease
MTNTTPRAALLAVLVALTGLPAAARELGPLERREDGAAPARLVPGRGLVKLWGMDARRLELSRRDDEEAQTALARLGKRHGVEIELVRAVVLGWALIEVRDAGAPKDMPGEEETLLLLERLASDPIVEGVSPEHWWRPLATPNDPGLPQMWHFDAIRAQQAWDVTQGRSTQRIGIVDTGLLRAHEDVGARAVRGFDFISSASQANDGNGRDADFNDAGDGCNGAPSSFHGTHVAGTVGAVTNNGRGVPGLNWHAGLVIARVLGRCGGSSVDIMEGAAWLAGAAINGVPPIGADKVSVMNLSLGGPRSCSSFEQRVIDFIDQQGVIVVAAAGNDGGAVNAPASCNKVVTVAAFGPGGARASYSSFGSQVEVVAPGGDQRFGQGAGVLSARGPQAGSYAFQQGTSMAAPHVAGAVSLLQAINPSLSRSAIVSALQASGRTCTNCGGKPTLDIPSALAAVGSSSQPPPPPPATVTDDPFEENDTLAQAVRAACGVDDSRLVAAPNDRDFFAFTPPANARIAVAIQSHNGADLDLYVTNRTGTILARSEGPTGTERITGTASGQPLAILVNPFTDPSTGFAHSGGYRLTITCGQTAAAAAADLDPGDGTEPVEDLVTGGELDPPDGPPDGPTDGPAQGEESQEDPPTAEPGVEDDDLRSGDEDGIDGEIDGEAGPRAGPGVLLRPQAHGGCSGAGAPESLAVGIALALLCWRRRTRRPSGA